MSVTDQWLESAIARHRVGQLQEAETIYRQILGIEPEHPDALHLLGVVANQVGRPKESIECITHSATCCTQPIALGLTSRASRYPDDAASSDRTAAGQTRPVEVRLEAEHKSADLEIAT